MAWAGRKRQELRDRGLLPGECKFWLFRLLSLSQSPYLHPNLYLCLQVGLKVIVSLARSTASLSAEMNSNLRHYPETVAEYLLLITALTTRAYCFWLTLRRVLLSELPKTSLLLNESKYPEIQANIYNEFACGEVQKYLQDTPARYRHR